MKKFFKSLAVLLALTLVIGTIPASAAETVTLSSKVRTLYLEGSKGETAEGVKCTTGATKSVKNMLKNYDAQTMKLTLESSAEDIVAIEGKSVVAKAVGTANVAVKVTDKATKETIYAETLKVTVKANVDAEKFASMITCPETAAVGETVKVVLSRKVAGVQVDTDARALACEDANVEIKATNDAKTTYDVTFKAAGEYTLKATAFQSEKYNKVLASADLKVKVALEATAVKQVASNAVEIEFTGDCSSLAKDAVKVYYMAGDAKIYGNYVNSITASTDKKSAVVVFFLNFAKDNGKYTVEVTDKEFTFEAAGNDYTAVKTCKIDGKDKVVTGVETAYKLNFYNEAGVDITSTVDTSKFNITWTLADTNNGYFTNEKVYFWTTGVSTKLSVKVEKLNDKYEFETVCSDEIALTSVDAAQATFNGVHVFSLTQTATEITKDAKAATTFAKGDTRYLQVIFDQLTGTVASTTPVLKYSATSGYKFASSDPTVVLVTEQNEGGIPQIYAVKEGQAYIKVESVSTTNGVTKTTLITAIPVQVSAARVASSITPSWSKNTLNISNADSTTLTVLVKDQYDEAYDAAPSISSAENYLTYLGGFNAATLTKAEAGKYTLTVNSAAVKYVKDGSYIGTVKVGTLTQTVNLAVASKGGATANGYKITGFENGTTFDTAVTATSKNIGTVTVGLNETNNGYFLSRNTITLTSEKPTRCTAASNTVSYKYTVSKNGVLLTSAQAIEALNLNTNTITFQNTTGATVTKAAAGTYVITVYKEVASDSANDWRCSVADTVTFTVKDSQVKPSFRQMEGTTELTLSTSNAIEVVYDCFALNFNGAEYDTKAKAEAAGYTVIAVDSVVDTVNKTMVINTVTVQITCGGDGMGSKIFTVKVPVSKFVYGA